MLAPFSSSLRDVYIPLPMLLFGVLSLASSLFTFIMPETIGTKLPDSIHDALNLGFR
ncbi:UNVERIFIED_CONTAM: hypothetical protein GTU68_066685 [Idotea baltica]|nr:hypothetical protein [Idotea baltica]